MKLSMVLAALIAVSVVVSGAIVLAAPQMLEPRVATSGTGSASSSTASSQTGTVTGSYPGSFFAAPQHDLFRSQGLWWTFENNGTAVMYRTSRDGADWSEPVVLLTSTFTTQYSFAVWFQDDTLYYAAARVFWNSTTPLPPGFFYRYGRLQPNGSISWDVASTWVQTRDHVFVEAIVTDGAGRAWVAGLVGNNTVSMELYRNYGNVTQWSMAKAVNGSYEASYGALVPLQTGMALIYGGAPDTCCPHSPIFVTTTTDGGRSWSPIVSPPSLDYYMTYSSTVSMGDTLYFLGPSLNPWELNFWTYTLGSNSTSKETVIAQSPEADTLSESNGVLVAAYVWNATIYERVSTDLGVHWSDPQAISNDEAYASIMTSTSSGWFGMLWNGAVFNNSQEVGHYAKFYSAPP